MTDANENWLAEAIRYLKGASVISSDKQIAEATGYSPQSISNMASGKVNISFKFKTKFEYVFGQYLVHRGVAEPAVSYGNERISELKYTIEVQKDLISELKEKVSVLSQQKKIPAIHAQQ